MENLTIGHILTWIIILTPFIILIQYKLFKLYVRTVKKIWGDK